LKLLSIVLHNYRKFQHVEIIFPDGITAIIGNNGSGKSTIIEAVGWAIYGSKVARTNKEGIRRQSASPNEECWARLTFELGGDVYEVTRMMTPSFSADANVKVNGLVAASSATGATRLLEKRIGMDYDAFFTSLVARQKEINALSSRTPGERKKSMLRMLKIDAIEDAVRKVRDDRKGKENVVEAMEGTLKDMDELKKGMDESRAKKESLALRLHETEDKISLLEGEVGELEVRREAEKKKAERYNELEREKVLVGERAESKRRQMEEKEKERISLTKKRIRYGEIEPLEKEYDALKKEKEHMEGMREKYLSVKKLREDITGFRKETEGMDKTIVTLEERLKEREKIGKEARELEVGQREITDKKEKIKSSIRIKVFQIKASEEKIEATEKERKKIEEMGPDSSCPTCGRPLEGHYGKIIKNFAEKAEGERKNIEALGAEQRSLKDELEGLDAEEEALKKRMDGAIKLMEEIKENEQRLGHVLETKKEREAKVGQIEGKIAGMGKVEFDEKIYGGYGEKLGELMPVKEDIIVLRNEIKRLPEVEGTISQLKIDMELLDKRAEGIAREIKELDFDKQRYEAIEKKYEEKRKEMQGMREGRVRLEGEIKQAKLDLERLEKDMKEQREARGKIKALRREIQQLETLAGDRDSGLLNDFRRYLISKIGPVLSYHASNFFNVFTGGKYSQMEIDDNYDIFIYDNGEKFAINRFSGGEEDLANLSLRLAISQIIAQRAGNLEFNFIVLDEIFGSQDNERRANVLNTLGELSHQFRQVILITHIEEIKDGMQYVIKTFEDEEGISHVRVE